MLIRHSLGAFFIIASCANTHAQNATVTTESKNVRAQLRATNTTILSAGISAKITSMPIKLGSMVKKNAVIAKFDCNAEYAEKSVIKAQNVAAKATLKVNQKLHKFKNISGLELKLSEAEVAVSGGNLKKINAILRDCVIRAPYSGQIIDKPVNSYQFVNKGEPLVELVDPSSLEFDMILPSSWLRDLSVGSPFNAVIDETGEVVNGKLSRIIGSIDPVSQTVRVIGELAEKRSNLLPGMSGDIQFQQ